ncbi:MAG: permease-like cell division protein FtsX [Candidatus Binatia bacterium]
MATLGFVARRAGHGLRQFFGSVILTSLTIALTLGVFGGFMLLQLNLEKLLRGWGDQLQLTAYLTQGVGAAELEALLARLQSFPEIEQVRHTSPEQAWRDFQASLGAQSGLLEGLPRDVLPASVEIFVRPSFRDSAAMEQLAGRLKQQKELTQIDYPQQWAERLSLVVLALQWAKWLVAGVLFLATFFLVSNMVRLALLERREEIELMQLVGASEALIQAPLVIEGLVQGLLGAGGGLAILWGVYRVLRDDAAGLSELVPALGRIEFLDGLSIALVLATGVVLGASASLFAARGMVRSWHASAR